MYIFHRLYNLLLFTSASILKKISFDFIAWNFFPRLKNLEEMFDFIPNMFNFQ